MVWDDNNNRKKESLGSILKDLGLDGIFKNTKGGSSNNNNFSSKSVFKVFGFVVVFAFIVWCALGIYVVDEQEKALVLTFGRYTSTNDPGLHWHAPLIQTLVKRNVTKIRSLDHVATMLTRDENIVSVKIVIQYKLKDIKDFVFNVNNPENALKNAAESALRHEVGGSTMDSILTEGREVLGDAVLQRTQNYIDNYDAGIIISKVNVEKSEPPAQVRSAFDDVIKAREDKVRLVNEAQTYANGLIPEARGRATRIIENAYGYYEKSIFLAKGKSARFTSLLIEYRMNPEITRERLYLETMQNILSNNNKVMLNLSKDNKNLVMIPFNNTMNNNNSAMGAVMKNTNLPSLFDSDSGMDNSNIDKRVSKDSVDNSKNSDSGPRLYLKYK